MQMDRESGLNLNNYRPQGLFFTPSLIWLGFVCANLAQDIIMVWSGDLGRVRVWSRAQDISRYISTLVRVYKYIKIRGTLIMSIYQISCHTNYEDSNIYNYRIQGYYLRLG